MENKDRSPAEQNFIDLMADGYSIEEIKGKLKEAPFNLSENQIMDYYKNADILRDIIETAKNRLGQVWGSMWRQIKQKAALGEIQESKILIDYVTNGKASTSGRLKVIFDDSDSI